MQTVWRLVRCSVYSSQPGRPQKKHQEKIASVTSKAKYSCDSRSSGEKSKAVSCCLCVNIVHTLIKMCVSAAGVMRPTMTSSEETTWAAILPPSCKAPVCSTETSSTSASTTRSEFLQWSPPPGHYPPLCSRVRGQHLSNSLSDSECLLQIYEIPFFVALDHKREAVLVAVRGTLSLKVSWD